MAKQIWRLSNRELEELYADTHKGESAEEYIERIHHGKKRRRSQTEEFEHLWDMGF